MKSESIQLPPAGQLTLLKAWLGESDASALHQRLTTELSWEQRSIVLFGKPVVQPRLISWAGAVPYRYSGQTLEPRSAPDFLGQLQSAIEATSKARFNHVLLNRYRDGSDSMGWHSDDEPELGKNPTLASLSLGATRRFLVRPKQKARPAAGAELWLGHGDLLVMSGDLQHHYRHALPKQRTVAHERINLTFRWILDP